MSADELNLSFDSNQDSQPTVDPNAELAEQPKADEQARTPGDVLFDGFGASEDAGDFLGLDTELHFSSSGAEDNVDMGLNEEDAAGLKLGPAPGEHDTSFQPPMDPAQGATADVYGDEDALYVEELYDDDELEVDTGEGAEEEQVGPHKGILALSALFAGAMVVVGAVYGPGLLDRFQGAESDSSVTTADNGNAGGASVVEPPVLNADAGTADSGTGIETSDPAVNNGADTGAEPNVASTTGEDPFFTSALGGATAPVRNGEAGSLSRLFSNDTFSLVPRVVKPSSGMTTVASGTDISNPSSGNSGIGDGSTASTVAIQFPGVGSDTDSGIGSEFLSSSVDWASSGDVDVIWRRNEIPVGAMNAPARVATPRVGAVRVRLTEDELFFDGDMVAMGEGRVWIQTDLGRLSFTEASIASIESLGEFDEAQDPGAIDAPIRGERVRVHAPGGVIYGHVVSQGDSGLLTLRTDDGGKITLANAQVEMIGKSRATIISD